MLKRVLFRAAAVVAVLALGGSAKADFIIDNFAIPNPSTGFVTLPTLGTGSRSDVLTSAGTPTRALTFTETANAGGNSQYRVGTVSGLGRLSLFTADTTANALATYAYSSAQNLGAGRTELLMHVFGALGRRTAGTVTLDGKPLGPKHSPSGSIDRGLVLISEDRKRYGLVLDRSIGFNLSLSSLPAVTRGPGAIGLVNVPAEAERSRGVFKSLRVKAPGLETTVGGLSGGNQQKVVIGKSLLTDPRVVLLDEPTRGIDVGAKIEVYELINELTAQGRAVVLVSSELPELMGMSDRIIMLSQGHVTGEFTREEATQEKLLAAAMADKLTPVEIGKP